MKQPTKTPRSLKKIKELEKKQIGLNQILKPALYLFLSFVFEVVLFIVLGFKTSSGGAKILPSYIFFDIGLWLIVAAIMLCITKNWLSNLIFYFAMLVKFIILIANVTLKGGFGYLFTFDMVHLIIEAIESIDANFINFGLIIASVIAGAFIVAIPLIFDKFLKNIKITLKKASKPIFCLLCFFITSTLGLGSYTIQIATIKASATNVEISSDKYLFDNMHIKDAAYKKFGSAGFYIKNLYDLCFEKASISEEEQAAALKAFEENITTTNSSAALYDNNLIIIMMESFEWFAIDPYNTPTLWALKTGENYYAQHIPAKSLMMKNYVSNNKTNVSEQLCLLGYMPNDSKLNLGGTNSYSAKYSLPNLFKRAGYTTNFFHNWEKTFYNRDTVTINLGFDKFYSLDDFSSPTKSTAFNYYNLEVDFTNQFINQIAPTDKKFMSFYTTVSTHGNYMVNNEKFADYYKKYDENLETFKIWLGKEGYAYPADETDQQILRHYKSAAIDTDKMVEVLFKHLNNTGLIENTSVLLYSDHNAYYHDLAYKMRGTVLTEYEKVQSFTVPCMLYSKKLTGKTVDTFCSTYDLYPTLTSLFGLPYNLMCIQGKDIMTNPLNNSLYVSHLTGFYDAHFYSKDMDYIIKTGTTGDSVLLEEFKTKVCEFYKKQQTLEIIYKLKLSY